MGYERWSQEEKDAFKKLSDKGYTIEQIGKVINRELTSLKAYGYRNNIKQKAHEINKEEFDRLMRGK